MATRIEGVVLDADWSEPVSGVTVYAYSNTGYTEGSTTTDSNGRFLIAGLTDRFWMVKLAAGTVGNVILVPFDVTPPDHAKVEGVEPNQHHAASHLSDHHTGGSQALSLDLIAGTVTDTGHGDQGTSQSALHAVMGDSDGDTLIQVEESADEDIIRFDTGATERATIDSGGLDVDTINELTGAAGVTVDGVLLKDGLVDGMDVAAHLNAYNGSFFEPMTFVITSNGTTITGTLDKAPSGDLTEVFSDGYTALSSGATVSLIAGSAIVPKKNYIYVLQSNKGVLVASDSDWPATEHIKVAEVVVQTAALVQSNGILANRNWDDHAQETDGMGHHLDAWKRLRWEHAAYKSGSAVTWSGSGTAALDLAISAGEIYQMHLHIDAAFDTTDPDNVYVVNHPTAYTITPNIETLVVDSGNASLSNRYYNLVTWRSVSSGSEEEQVFINLPSGSYKKQSDAENDVSGFDNFAIPTDYRGYAYLVQRVTIKHSVGGGTWTIHQETDLRGTVPSLAVGGGTLASVTEFADSAFKIFDDGDPTKEIAFQASSISASTTRTVTAPDKDLTLIDSADAITAVEGEDTLLLAGNVSVAKSFSLSGDISPSQLTANTNNWDPTGLADASVIRVSTDASRDLTGIVPKSPDDGRVLILHNIGAQNLVLKDASGSSTAANRFALSGDITLAGDDAVTLQYDTTTNRWRAIGSSPGGGGGSNHDILDGSVHQDSVADGVTRGSIVYGNSTPKWDELVIGAANRVLRSDGTDAAWAQVALATDVSGTLPLANGGTGATSIKQSFVLYARDGHPSTTAGADGPIQVEFGTNDVDIWVIDFDKDTDEYAWWEWESPKNWDAGTVTFRVTWLTITTATGDVEWTMDAVGFGEGDAIDTAFGTAVAQADNGNATGNDVLVSAESSALTIASASTIAAGDLVVFRMLRDVSLDNLTADARLISIRIEYGITSSLSDT